jgi:hypothetical protein
MWRVKGFRWAASDTRIAPEVASSHGAHSSEVVLTFKTRRLPNAILLARSAAHSQRKGREKTFRLSGGSRSARESSTPKSQSQ